MKKLALVLTSFILFTAFSYTLAEVRHGAVKPTPMRQYDNFPKDLSENSRPEKHAVNSNPQRLHALIAEKGPIATWSFEDKYVYLSYVLWPDEGTLSCETAFNLAKKALNEIYGLSDDEVEKYEPYVWYEEGETIYDRVWRFDFGYGDDYQVFLVEVDSSTGEIVYTSSDKNVNG